MTRIKMDKKGVYSENAPTEPVTITVPSLQNTKSGLVAADESGVLSAKSVAERVRYEYHEAELSQSVTTSADVHVLVDGGSRNITRGLTTWNTASSVFYPENSSSIYTIVYDGRIADAPGNPNVRFSFITSGSDPDTTNILNQQSISFTVETGEPSTHIHATFHTVESADLTVSGGIILARTTGGDITILSSSVLIKEG